MSAIVLPYAPWEYQIPLHTTDTRFTILVGGRRSGKSYCAFQELLKQCLSKPDQLWWWVAQTYSDAMEIGFDFFLDLYDILEPAISNVHLSTMRVSFINGSVISFKGCNNPHSLRGRGLDGLVLDEAAFVQETVWKKSLRPALSDKQGRAILTSSPNGKNWFYDQTILANTLPESWTTLTWTSDMSPLMTAEDLAQARSELSLNDYKQEYGAQFVTMGGMVFEDFCSENIVERDIDLTRDSFYLGADFGFANPTSIVFLAVNLAGNVYQFDEIYMSRTSMENLIIEIQRKLTEHGLSIGSISRIYTDPAGNADELSSGISPVDCLRKAGFNVVNKGSKINPGLALVRSYILNANQERRYHLHPRCKDSIRSLEGYSYNTGRNGLPRDEALKDGIHDHAADAIRYFFVNKFDLSKYVANVPDQHSYLEQSTQKSIMKRCGKCRKPFVSYTPKNQPPLYCKGCVTNV